MKTTSLLLCVLAAPSLAGCGGKIDPSSETPVATPDAGPAVDAGRPVDAAVPPTAVDASVPPHAADSSPPPLPDAAPPSSDATTTPDDGGDAAALACAAPMMTFTPIVWAPPTALHQGLCTPAQTQAYNTALNGNGPYTSGSETCDACLQTAQSAPAHGPIVTIAMQGTEIPAELNVGGCVADIDGMKMAGGCGNVVNDDNDCAQNLCATCQQPNDFQACTTEITNPGQACAAYAIPAACDAELSSDGGVQACLQGDLTTFLDLWCGP